jgi:radical SAM protein with 4Fe4S-binding SPASM domain
MLRNGIQFAVKGGANYLQQQLAYRFDRPFNEPMQITVSITDACAARCVMCDIWKLPVKDEMTAAEWIQSLDQMRKWMGSFWLSLSGGEPFQKPGIFDILKFCRDNQIKTKISSNGIMLRETYLDRVLRYGPDFLSLSVESPRAELHDTLRGTPGLHARCVEALHYLRARDPHIVLGVATVIMEDNYRELPGLVRWAVDQGADRVLFQPLQPNFGSDHLADRNWHRESPHWVQDIDTLERVIDELLAMQRAGFPIWNDPNQLEVFKAYFRDPYTHPRPEQCMVRYNIFNIDPRGNVNFCWTVNDTVGNIRQTHPAEIWRSPMAKVVREKMRLCRAPCTLNCHRSRSLSQQIELFRFLWKRQGF